MPIVTLGLNHNTAPLAVREQVAFAGESLVKPLSRLQSLEGISEAAIVSTCNRTEIYCGLEKGSEHRLTEWFHRYHRLAQYEFSPYLIQREGRDAIHHLLRVCCGLDSMVLGEPQILGQIKKAYAKADEVGALGQHLTPLFHHAFKVAKQVRTETDIGGQAVSVAFVAVALARKIFKKLAEHTVLLIGAGETIELTARYLRSDGISRLLIANRSLARAQRLAQTMGGRAFEIKQVPTLLQQADIVISSTASQLPILGKGMVEQALKARKHRLFFMLDLAVPRDIEPQVGELDDVFLYTVDDLQKVALKGQQKRLDAAVQAEQIVQSQVESYMRQSRARLSADIIRQYREHAEHTKQQVLEKARQALQNGKPSDKVIEEMAHVLTNKLLHHPSSQLRKAAAEGDQHLLKSARQLLNRDDEKTRRVN